MPNGDPMPRATLARATYPDDVDVAEAARNLHQAVLLLQEVRRLHAVARWRGHSDRDVNDELLRSRRAPEAPQAEERTDMIDAASD